ncbi:MAG: HAD-IA family hydrolase [Nitriliruptorales bacterium]|nr:HAD-IA family hydrolase [Nitriliruptorales bacterium]
MTDIRSGVLLDLDGTLVDSVYHHVLAWDEAFSGLGLEVPLWRVHAAIGMGGDRLVPWVLGKASAELDDAVDDLKQRHEDRFLSRAAGLRATDGALALLADLEGRGVPFLVATSSSSRIVDALLAALGRQDVDVTHGDDVDTTKPSPDPVLQACVKLGVEPGNATMVGDSPWDAEAAARVGVRTIGLHCGGFSTDVLMSAGAIDVADHPRDLIGRL